MVGVSAVHKSGLALAPMTLGNAAAAHVRLIVWCLECRYQVEPDPAVMAERHSAETTVPERHARFLKVGDSVRIDGEEFNKSDAQFGTIRLVYPQIEDGRVIADAAVAGLGEYFVGERIRVWVSAGDRESIIVPGAFIVTRFGIDYARVRKDAGATIDVLHEARPWPGRFEITPQVHFGDETAALTKPFISRRSQRYAASPDSNAPSWFEALMNTISIAFTRPRSRLGLASATIVERMFML